MSLLLSREPNDLRGRMNRLFEDGEAQSQSPRAWAPAVDVSEDEHEIVLHVEIPGMKKDEIDIQLTGDTLRLSGERRREEGVRGEQFHRMERQYGAWQRTFQIETPLDSSGVTANYELGVLTVRLPKAAIKPRQIQIETK